MSAKLPALVRDLQRVLVPLEKPIGVSSSASSRSALRRGQSSGRTRRTTNCGDHRKRVADDRSALADDRSATYLWIRPPPARCLAASVTHVTVRNLPAVRT